MFHIFCMSVLLVNMAKERAELLHRQNSLVDSLTGVPNRRVATPDEIADAAAWLLRPASRGITGHALPIDGGGLALP